MTRRRCGQAVPCGLLEGGKVTKPIRKGELLTYDNAAVDARPRGSSALRKRQDDTAGRDQ